MKLRYLLEDMRENKRIIVLFVILAVLFAAANLKTCAALVGLIAGPAWPVWALLLVTMVGGGLVGLLVMAFTAWLIAMALMLALLITSACLSIAGVNPKNEEAQTTGAINAAFGLSVAYWIGYRFYMLWIK